MNAKVDDAIIRPGDTYHDGRYLFTGLLATGGQGIILQVEDKKSNNQKYLFLSLFKI
jgi:hypothetical protein